MFKFLTKSLRPLCFRPLSRFSQRRQQLLTLSQQLLTQHQTFKAWKTVRLLHSLTMARYDPELAEVVSRGREQQAQLQSIIDSLSGELHLMPHREVNMLMEVLRERGYTYDRTLPIFKALNKTAKLFFGKQYRALELTKSLQLYKQLGFPKQTWVKMVSNFLEIDVQRTKKQENLRMNVVQFLRLAILVLEQPYIPLPHVKTLIERLIKQNANNLDTLTTLYHITRILPNCLKANMDYQLTRSNVRDVLFNPYSQLEEHETVKGEENEGQQSAQKQTLRLKLNQATSEILKLFFSAVDVAKLEQTIIKSIESDIEPLTKQNLLFASDIVQLKPIILTYLHQHSDKLTPVEFLHLLRKVPPESASLLLKSYQQKLGKYMSVQERVFFHLESHRCFRTPIKVELVFSMLQSVDTITYHEFMAIARLLQDLPESSKARIPQILGLIKSKIRD